LCFIEERKWVWNNMLILGRTTLVKKKYTLTYCHSLWLDGRSKDSKVQIKGFIGNKIKQTDLTLLDRKQREAQDMSTSDDHIRRHSMTNDDDPAPVLCNIRFLWKTLPVSGVYMSIHDISPVVGVALIQWADEWNWKY